MKPSLAILPVAAIAAIAVATTADGQSPSPTPPTTLTLVEHSGHFTLIDAPPKGGTRKPPSLGDTIVIGARLSDAAGHATGTANLTCTITQAGAKGLSVCSGALVLTGGTLTFAGASRVDTNSDTYAITGGTGDYANAAGTLGTQQGKGDTEILTVQLG
jgi:hypothetical protein